MKQLKPNLYVFLISISIFFNSSFLYANPLIPISQVKNLNDKMAAIRERPIQKSTISKFSNRLANRIEAKRKTNQMRLRALRSKNFKKNPEETIRVVGEMKKGSNLDKLLIKKHDGKILYTRGKYFGIEIPESKFTTLVNSLQETQFFRLPYSFEADEITGAGVSSIGAETFHNDGITGEQVDIAVIDIGFKGLADAINSNDIPGTVVTQDFTGNGLETEYMHGTACAEIIHEIAPGAQLHLLKISDDVNISQAFDYCVANNIDIINLSIGTFGSGPGDGTGPLHDMCAYAEENGILVVASAGNFSVEADGEYTFGRHWEGVFTDSDNDGAHNFLPNTNYNAIIAVPGWNDDGLSLTNELKVLLRWNDWPNASIDYDLHLFDFYTGEHIASSSVVQDGTAPPVEMIVIDIPDNIESQAVAIEVTRKDGSPVGTELELYLGRNSYFVPFNSRTEAFATAESSLGEPGDSPSVLTVGAIHNEKWTTGPQEEFSSQGPTNAWAGSRALTKPDIMGLDGVLTQVGGGRQFTGTSAAAPHVSGAAALIKSKYPELKSNDLKFFLTENAIDMGEEHKDNVYGWGRLNIENLNLHYTKIIKGAESPNFSMLLRDDFRDRIYVGDPYNNNLLVIDTETESVVEKIPCDSNFDDMAISKDGNKLAVAGGDLKIIDLETYQIDSYTPDPDILSVAFDYKGDVLYAWGSSWRRLRFFNPETGSTKIHQYVECSSFSTELSNGLVRTGPRGRNVYFASRGSSPGRIVRYTISGTSLTCAAQTIHGEIDSIFDLEISNDEQTVYTQEDILDFETLEKLSQLPLDEYKLNRARNICLDRSGRQLHGTTSQYIESITIDPLNIESIELKFDQISPMIESSGIDIERYGKKVFYILGVSNNIQQVQVLKKLKPITVIMPATANETDGILEGSGMVRLLEKTDQDLIVYLQSNSSRVQVPEQVIIPAGQRTALFDIIFVDNSLVESLSLVQINASAQGFDTVFSIMDLTDDETLSISLQLPDMVTEGQTEAITGKVILNPVVGSDFLVSLESSDTSEIQIPGVITVASGQSEADFILEIQDDAFFDGPQALTINADVAGQDSAEAGMIVQDNEIKEISITCPDELTEGYVYEDLARISIPGIAVEDLTVNLSSSNTCKSFLPLTATISAGESTAFFDIDLPGDTFRNPMVAITLEALTPGWSTGSKQVDVIDNWRTTEPFQINSYTLDNQETPSVAGFKNGGFVAVWVSEHQDGVRDGIYAQIFDKDNNKIGDEFQINTQTSWDPEQPSVIGLSNGGFAVAWESHSSNILIQFFDEYGSETSEEILITTSTSGSLPSLNEFSDGQVAVTYKHTAAWGSYPWLYARFIHSENHILGQELPLFSINNSFIPNYKIASMSSNIFMVVASYYSGEIIAQLFDQSGSPIGDSMIVNTTSDGQQIKPEAITLEDGRILVTWTCMYSLEIKGRFFTSEGVASGDEFVIASHGLNLPSYSIYHGPSVIPLKNGRFVATWSLSNQNEVNGIFAQLFSPQGDKIGGSFRMSEYYLSADIAIGGLEDSDWVIIEREKENLSTDTDLFAKRMSMDLDNDDDGIIDTAEDSNNNGCFDVFETHPLLLDTDGDGIQDGTELGLTLSDIGPYTDISVFIPDMDPLTITDPTLLDSDLDGLNDAVEDFNANGFVDSGETDPASDDTDKDGLPDGYEIVNNLDPLFDDAFLDKDGDGYSNLREFLAGTLLDDRFDIPTILADFEPDFDSDAQELFRLAEELNRVDCDIEPCFCDFNNDGRVDIIDLKIFLEDYGRMD